MGFKWIDKFNCDRCQVIVELDHSASGWPKNWRKIVIGTSELTYCQECFKIIDKAIVATYPTNTTRV
jgi:hypothetical protein